jgi:hypothetical protein
MDRMDASSRAAETSVRRRNVIPEDWYVGVDLAPRTLEGLVLWDPWDVSARARREQARLSSAAYRIPTGIHGGY